MKKKKEKEVIMQWMHANRPSKETNALQLEVQLRGAYKKHFDHYAYIIGGFHYPIISIFSRPKIQNFRRKLKLLQACSVGIQYIFLYTIRTNDTEQAFFTYTFFLFLILLLLS